MNFLEKFEFGLPYQQFLQQYGSELDRTKWSLVADRVKLTEQQQELIKNFPRDMKVLCMAGAWCGDCSAQCPIFAAIEDLNPRIQIRYVDRDADPDLAAELKICGGSRVPQVVFLSEDGLPVARYGDRTLTKYRQMAAQLTGAACSTGLVGKDDPVFQQIVQEWIEKFERCQLILRTSPSLRKKHGD